MYLSLLLGFLLFPEIPATLETHVLKKLILNTLKCRELWYFVQIVKSNLFQKTEQLKSRENFIPRKFLAIYETFADVRKAVFSFVK